MRAVPFLLLVAVSFASADVHAADVAARTTALVEAFKTVQTAEEGKKLSKEAVAANRVAMTKIDAWFDFDAFTASCLGKSAAKFSEAEKKRFGELLTGILRNRGYTNGGRVFRDGKVTHGKVTTAGDRRTTPMTIYFAKQDLTLESAFVYGAADKIIDLIIDGDSLTRDFSNQIARMLTKKKPADVLRMLEKKLAATAEAVQ